MCDAGSCHGSAGTDLPEALRVSDPVTQPGNPLRQERSAVRTAQHRPAHGGAAAGRQLCDEVTVRRTYLFITGFIHQAGA